MAKIYFVVDAEENLTSYSLKKEKQEYFTSEGAAIARAKQLANQEPGKDFFVCKAIKTVFASVNAVEVADLK